MKATRIFLSDEWLFVMLMILLGPGFSQAQHWQWNTFMGSSGLDYGYSIAVDGSGNVYVAGDSYGTWGSPINAYAGRWDAFVAKLDNNGVLLWHTFLGSELDDEGRSIAVDGNGNVYVGGFSYATWGSPVNTYTGLWDAFAAKLDNSGALIWNTFLGSSTTDYAFSIVVDGSNNVYVAGSSGATWGMPVSSHAGNNDAYVAKLNDSGTLLWNTFLGSSANEVIQSIVIDGSGYVYLVGYGGANWGSPVNPHSGNGSIDAFAGQLNNSGTLLWNTFLGSEGTDFGHSIAVDYSGNLYLAGESDAAWGSPVNAYAGLWDAFATKLNNSGVMQWHTFQGSSGTDYGQSIAVDASGEVFLSGRSDATWGMPINSHAGGNDAYVAKLNNAGALQGNTFLGSSGTDWGQSIAVDAACEVYVSGRSDATWGVPINAHAGNQDAFITKLASDDLIPVELSGFSAASNGIVVNLSWSTATETENLGFHVYRSLAEGGEYFKITQQLIKGAGSSDQAHYYSYTDRDVQSGMTYYYKLADVDFNGNINFHGPISVTVAGVPSKYSLAQCYPNPFNPETAITFSIKEAGKVSLNIYNLQGQLIRSLVDEEKLAGSYSVIWNGTDDQGVRISSGTYLYTLKVNGFEETKKLTYMK